MMGKAAFAQAVAQIKTKKNQLLAQGKSLAGAELDELAMKTYTHKKTIKTTTTVGKQAKEGTDAAGQPIIK